MVFPQLLFILFLGISPIQFFVPTNGLYWSIFRPRKTCLRLGEVCDLIVGYIFVVFVVMHVWSQYKHLLPASLPYHCPLSPTLVIVMASKRVDSSLVDFIAFLQVLIAFAVVALSQDVPIPDDVIREIVVQMIDNHDLPPLTGKCRHRRIVSPSHSNPPKRACIQYDYKRAEESVFSDWVGPVPRFPDKQFESTFRIKQSMVDIILNHLASTNRFWTKTICRAGKETISPYVKLLCAL